MTAAGVWTKEACLQAWVLAKLADIGFLNGYFSDGKKNQKKTVALHFFLLIWLFPVSTDLIEFTKNLSNLSLYFYNCFLREHRSEHQVLVQWIDWTSREIKYVGEKPLLICGWFLLHITIFIGKKTKQKKPPLFMYFCVSQKVPIREMSPSTLPLSTVKRQPCYLVLRKARL